MIARSRDRKLRFTEIEQAYLKQFLDAHDRNSFYLSYQAFVSSEERTLFADTEFGKAEASLQAKIASFSEETGAAAFLTNRVLQEKHASSGLYDGIYFLSQRVAESGFRAMVDDANSISISGPLINDGLISDDQFFESAAQAWRAAGAEILFPGRLFYAYDLTGSPGGSPENASVGRIGGAIIALNAEIARRVGLGQFNPASRSDWLDLATSDGAFAAFLATVYFAIRATQSSPPGDQALGKQTDSDSLIYTPDGQLAFSMSGDKVVAIQSAGLSGSDSIFEIGIEIQTLLNSFVEDIPGSITAEQAYNGIRSLFEPHYPSDWSLLNEPSGDFQPPAIGATAHENVIRSAPTVGNDTIFGTSSFIGIGGANTINGLAGNDTIVAGSGDDDISGEDGDDILWGQGGHDTLTGGAGDDVIRGGAGDDVIRPGEGSEFIDGSDAVFVDDGLDTADYSDLFSTQFISVQVGNLAPGYLVDSDISINKYLSGNDLGPKTDYLVGIERIVGTSQADELRLVGQLQLRDWIDLEFVDLSTSENYPHLDTVNAELSAHGVYIDLRNANDQILFDLTSGLTGNGLRVKNAEIAVGSAFDDILYALSPVLQPMSLYVSRVDGGTGNDLIYGGSGRDYLDGGADNDVIYGSLLFDDIQSGGAGDVIDGGDGNDSLIGGNAFSIIYGGLDNDQITLGKSESLAIDYEGINLIYARAQTGRVFLTEASWNSYEGNGLGGAAVSAGATLIDLAGNTGIYGADKQDRLTRFDVSLYGGVQQWWNETGIAVWSPYLSLLAAFPFVGAQALFAAAAINTDVQFMKFAKYKVDAETGDLLISLDWGLGSTARVHDFDIDLNVGRGDAGITVFKQGKVKSGISSAIKASGGVDQYVNLALYAGFGLGLPGFDPLVLDLDGNGYDLIGQENSQAYFEFDNDGFAENAGWIGGNDAFLARDLNGNGSIDTITELFGNRTTSGFAALAALDSNADGVIDSADAAFSTLRLWKDANSNAVTDAGELVTLASAGIASISLASVALDPQDPEATVLGNSIVREGSFTRTDGTTGSVGDVALVVSDTDTRWTGSLTTSQAAPVVATSRSAQIWPCRRKSKPASGGLSNICFHR